MSCGTPLGSPFLRRLSCEWRDGVLTKELWGKTKMYDILLKKGRVVDGTGNPWCQGDLAIRDGKIAAIGELGAVEAQRVINVERKIVAPGFIDIHGHSDYLILANPQAENKIMQGITTDTAGNCGFSAAPLGGVWLQEWWVENPLDRFTVVSRAKGQAGIRSIVVHTSVAIIYRLAARGAEGVILDCTEIPMLVSEADAGIPLFDTTALYAEAVLSYVLR